MRESLESQPRLLSIGTEGKFSKEEFALFEGGLVRFRGFNLYRNFGNGMPVIEERFDGISPGTEA